MTLASINRILKDVFATMKGNTVPMLYRTGTVVRPRDGSDYRGVIVWPSPADDTVVHACLKTGKRYEKSWWGFDTRYMQAPDDEHMESATVKSTGTYEVPQPGCLVTAEEPASNAALSWWRDNGTDLPLGKEFIGVDALRHQSPAVVLPREPDVGQCWVRVLLNNGKVGYVAALFCGILRKR